jgi:hypothetical protein
MNRALRHNPHRVCFIYPRPARPPLRVRNNWTEARFQAIVIDMRAAWRIMLDGAIEEALLAVDLYNQPRRPRRLEGFLVHMHTAWLYLLHAEFRRDGVDYRYRLPNGRFERIEGEPRTWDLQKCVEEHWPDGGPERLNLELTIALRNRIVHRYHEATALVVSGYAQALLLNFEEELTNSFGSAMSLGEQLRFPIFAGDITALGEAKTEELRESLPKTTRDFLARFEANLDSSIANDQRYEFRVTLVPTLSAKSDADRALRFIRESELSDGDKKALQELGRTGTVVVREQTRPVASADKFTPSSVVEQVRDEIPFHFHMGHFVRAWKAMGCRPATGAQDPKRTDERYCVYDVPHGDYLYKAAFVNKVVREIRTAERFERFLGLPPKPKANQEAR